MEENEEKIVINYFNFKRKLHNFKTNLITTLRYILAKKYKMDSFIFTRLRILRYGQMCNEF